MLDKYKKVSNTTSNESEMDWKVVNSILLYIRSYQNTSLQKKVRLDELNKAKALLEFVANNVKLGTPEGEILFAGFNKILLKTTQAVINSNELYDFKDEIGFLNIVLSIVKQ